jgi:hypothetical protein
VPIAAVPRVPAACTDKKGGTPTTGADVKIGIITAKSGPYAPYGTEYLAGLNAGIDDVTHGTGRINGHRIVLEVQDDADNPTTAVSEAKDLIGQGVTVDLFTPDGFTVAQLFAHAIEADPSDVGKQITALGGWSFRGVAGQYTVRAADHALLRPEFQVTLSGSGTAWMAKPVKAVDPAAIAPPPPAKLA